MSTVPTAAHPPLLNLNPWVWMAKPWRCVQYVSATARSKGEGTSYLRPKDPKSLTPGVLPKPNSP